MFKLPLYGKKKLRLAFEYGLTIAQTAHEMKVEMTPELIERAEEMIVGEFTDQSAQHVALNMVPNILTAFELDLTK